MHDISNLTKATYFLVFRRKTRFHDGRGHSGSVKRQPEIKKIYINNILQTAK